MSLFERVARMPIGAPDDPPQNASPDPSGASGSSSDADDSAAHIAELVRRTTVRDARSGPSTVARPDATLTQPLVAAAPVIADRAADDAMPLPRPARRRLSPTTVAAGVAVAAVLVTGALMLSRPVGSDARSTKASATPAKTALSSAPAGYAVKVTDVITDCASHAHGQAKRWFETENCAKATRSLATGRVSGRAALFVVSRVQMTSAEAAASVKQVLDADGTGNLNDLLRDGRTFPGAPAVMPDSGYDSVQTGDVVVVAEAGFVDGGPTSSTSPALRAAAAQVSALVTAQG